MSKSEALTVIEQAMNAATMKGAFTLSDVEIIIAALAVIKSELQP